MMNRDSDAFNILLTVVLAIVGWLFGLTINVTDYATIFILLIPILFGIYICVYIRRNMDEKSCKIDEQLKTLDRFTKTIIDDEISIKEFKRELIINENNGQLSFIARTTRLIQNTSDVLYPDFKYSLFFEGDYSYKPNQKAIIDGLHTEESKQIKKVFITDENKNILITKYDLSVAVSIQPGSTKSLVVEQDVSDCLVDAMKLKRDFVGIRPEYQTDYLEIKITNNTQNYKLDLNPDSLTITDHRNKRDLVYESKVIKRFNKKENAYSVWDPIREHTFRVYFTLEKK